MATPIRPLALTLGEPAGIAGEITLKAWLARKSNSVPAFALVGDPEWLSAEARLMSLDVPIVVVDTMADAANHFQTALPVLPVPLPVKPEHGRPSPQNAGTVVRSIETAVSAVRNGEAIAVVTNPIHKASLYADGFRFPGHTEFLASLSGNASPLMMLAIEGLRVVPVTVHMSLASAAASLTRDTIIAAAMQAHASLVADFGISNPRLAIAALNPHAGENGAMGSEEADIIGPAIAALRDRGIDVTGPHPADTMFHAAARKQYDVAICMYHDQALIPLKTLDFEGGVNITLGLPFIRTSPDHGTAFDIAGKGKASAVSLIRAMQLADRLARRRLEHA